MRCLAEFVLKDQHRETEMIHRGMHVKGHNTTCVCMYVSQNGNLTYSEHVVALHVLGVFIVTLVVKLPEEVEGHNSVEIHDNCQQADCQDQLTNTHIITKEQAEADEYEYASSS